MDTGPLVPKEEWNHLFKTGGGSYQNPHFHDTALDEDGAGMLDQSLGLSSVATFIHSLHGDYGFREEESFGGDVGKQPHSVFWFSVPLIVDKPKSDPARKSATSKAVASTPGATATADKSDNGATSTSSVVTDSRQSSMQDDGRQNQQQQQPAATDTAATQTATDPTDTACQRTRSLSCAAALVGNTMEAMPERRDRGLSGGTLLELAGSAAMQLERNLSNPGLHEHFDSGNEKLSAAAASSSSSSSTSFPPSNLQVVVGDLLHATTALQKSQGTSSSFPSLLYEKHEQKQALEARAATVAAGSPLLFSSTSPLFTGQSATTAAGVPSLLLPNTIQSFSDVIADAAASASCKLKDVGQPNQSWPATRTMNNAPTTATATTTTSPIGRRKKRGLVIDDSLVVRKSLARALERQDFEVQQAVNGLEGLNLLKETLFDLVLCDFLMPVMDGMDCVKQYRDWEREHHSGFRQYIVGISAHATSNDGNQGIKAGMDLFKEKPISVRILSELLEADEFLQRSAEIDSKEGASSVTVVEMSKENVVGKRPAMTAALDANGFHHESFAVPPTKFLKSDHAVDSSLPPMSETKKAAPACLIATKALTQESHQILTNLENNGWETAVANDGQEALRLLQTRNWDAICMDDDLPILAGTPCMTKFRAWEAEHRVNRQRMALLICSSHDVKIPPPLDDDKTSIVLPPHGFDGVLGKPVQWNELNHLLQRRTTGRSFDIVIRK
jgi:CheY-like chemotaxis protein